MKYRCPDTVLFLPAALDRCWQKKITVWRGIAGWHGEKEGGGSGGTIHMSCFYSNCWPGAWVSDNCLLTTFKQASCWTASVVWWSCVRQQVKSCWELDEAPLCRDRLSFLWYSILCLSETSALPSVFRLQEAATPNFYNFKRNRF